MLKIVRSTEPDAVVYTLTGRIEVAHAAELEDAFAAETLAIVVDLFDVRLVDRDAVPCLTRWRGAGIALRNCPAYIREWIDRSTLNLKEKNQIHHGGTEDTEIE